MKKLRPDFKTIADFRKNNGAAIRNACRAFIEFCRQAELLTVDRVAIDGSKFKSAGSIDQHLKREHVLRDRALIEEKIQSYLQRLDAADHRDTEVTWDAKHVQQALERLRCRSARLDQMEQGMNATGVDEYCLTEPEARMTRSGREGLVLGYNAQAAVEEHSGLIVHHEVTNEPGDTRLLAPMATQTQAALGVRRLEVLADAGYSNGEHLDICERNGITATVPRRIIPGSSKHYFQKKDFIYDAASDSYRCPAGQLLTRGGQDKRRKLHIYQRSGCKQCPMHSQCTKADKRSVTRHFFEDAYARCEARLNAEPALMLKRMSIAERPFAVIKHLLAFRRFSCRGLHAAKTEMAIAVLAHNIKRMVHVLGVPRMLALLN